MNPKLKATTTPMPDISNTKPGRKLAIKDPVEKRILELCKEAQVQLDPTSIKAIRDAAILAAMSTITQKSVIDFRLAMLAKEADELRKRSAA